MEAEIFKTHHISIDKHELADLPCAGFRGSAVVIERDAQVKEAIDELEASRIIGFDTETKPSFRKGVTHFVSLLQLATPNRCFLFRLNKIGLDDRLVRLLENPDLLKVGLSIHDDFHNLSKIRPINPDGFVDLQHYVKEFHIADNSLARIHAILFGERISKGQRLTNWEAATLTTTQINYASLDAVACIRIYDYLKSGKFNPLESKYLIPIPEPEVSTRDNRPSDPPESTDPAE